MTAVDLEALRLSLPVSDPDQHALDTVADDLFSHLAPGYPNTCSPTDFAASTAAGYNPPVTWDDKAARTAEVQTGRVL